MIDLSEQGLEQLEAYARGDYFTDEFDLDPDAIFALISALRQAWADFRNAWLEVVARGEDIKKLRADLQDARGLLERLTAWFGTPEVQGAFSLQAIHGGLWGEEGRQFSEEAGKLWTEVRALLIRTAPREGGETR